MRIHTHIPVLLVCAGFLLQTGCGSDAPDSSAPETGEMRYPTQEGWNSTYRISTAGRPQAVIRYGHMAQYENEQITYFDDSVTVDFYDEAGRHSSTLTSDRGIYNEATNDVFGVGNVKVVSDTGVTLLTEKLRWDQKREKIVSDTLVTVVTEDQDTLHGRGFESEPDLSKMVFKETWGKTHKRVDFERVEEELTRKPEPDTVRAEQAAEGTAVRETAGGDTL